MAVNTNTNPFLSDEDDFIEHAMEESTVERSLAADSQETNWDSIAAKLLKDKFTLTALELHTELVEAGRELPRLRDFFSNPGNFERTREDSPPSTLPRTSSIQTFDSLDFARYSDDGERQVDERVAVLEFELRKAQETIKSLRASLTKEAEKEHVTQELEETGQPICSTDDTIKAMEQKALNFLVNEYLLQINNKLTAVTFSEENEEQDFEDWDDVGLNIPQPPTLLCLYRDYHNHVLPAKDVYDTDCQTDMEGHMLEQIQQELAIVKTKLGDKIAELKEKLLYKDKEMLRRRGVAEGSESDPPVSPYNENQSTIFDDIPFNNYAPEDHSDIEEDCDMHCTCENEEKCSFCTRVHSPEVYRLDFTDVGDQDTLDSGSNDGDNEEGRLKKKVVKTDHSETIVSDENSGESANVSENIKVCDINQNKDTTVENRTGIDTDVKNSNQGVVKTRNDNSEVQTKEVTSQNNLEVRKRERTPIRRKGKESKDTSENTGDGFGTDDKSSRKMSTAFSKALKDVCFNVPKDNRIVLEVSKISDADQQKVVLMLGRCVPHIVPNVLLAKREELIPLIICTAMLHPDAKERDNLLNILFNLIKKPDEEQRHMILTGCIAFAQHVGPTRLEAELLPQCWEQISHKYMERRLLVAEACGALAGYLPSDIRSSLVLSMLQQMLQDDKEADVREAAVRSLGLIIGFISDKDKYPQGADLLKTALKDSVEKVVTSAKQIFLPSFAMWAYELGKLEHCLLHNLLRDLEELVKTAIATQKSQSGMAPLNEGRFLLYVTTLQELVPFLYISVLESGPYMDKLDDVLPTTEDLHASRFPKSSSVLTDLTTIVGNKKCLAAMVRLFEEHIDQEWFEPWDNLNWVVNNLIPRLLEVVMGSALSFPRIVSCLARCFYKICTIFGKTFVDKKVKPRFIDVLLMSEEHIDPSSNFTSNSTPFTTCVVPVYASGVLSAFNTEEDQTQLAQFLREALFCLSIYQSSTDSLRIAITELW